MEKSISSPQPETPISVPDTPVKNPADDSNNRQTGRCSDPLTRDLILCRILYFILYFSKAPLKFFSIYLSENGVKASEIGAIEAIPGLTCILSGPFWGYVSDKTRGGHYVTMYCIGATCALMFTMKYVSNFFLLCVLQTLASFHMNAIFPLLDEVIMTWLTPTNTATTTAEDKVSKASVVTVLENGKYEKQTTPEVTTVKATASDNKRKAFGRQRLFGSLGSGMGAIFTSEVLKNFDNSHIFTVQSGMGAVAIAGLWFLGFNRQSTGKNTMKEDEDAIVKKIEEEDESGDSKYKQLWQWIRQQRVLWVLFCFVFLLGIMNGTICSFLSLYFFNLSNKHGDIVAVHIAISTFVEVPFFFFAESIIEAIGTSWVFIVATVCYAIRFFSYAILKNAWFMLPLNVLHGVTYGLAWAAATTYVYKVAPANLKALFLGILAALMNGIGRGTGSMLSGWIQSNWGAPMIWWYHFAIVTPIGMVIAIWFFYESRLRSKKAKRCENSLASPFLVK